MKETFRTIRSGVIRRLQKPGKPIALPAAAPAIAEDGHILLVILRGK